MTYMSYVILLLSAFMAVPFICLAGYPGAAQAKGLVKNGRFHVKILGQGELTKKLTVKVHAFSAAAKAAIEAAGGVCEVISKRPGTKK